MSDNGFIIGYAVVLVLLLLLISVSCAPVKLNPWDYPTDQVGNPWPEACKHDLQLETLHVSVYPVERKNIGGANGVFVSFGAPNSHGVLEGIILISDDMQGWAFSDTRHHERCHAVAGMAWHK